MKPVVGYKTTAVRKYDWQPELEGHMAGGKGLSTAFGNLKKYLRHRSMLEMCCMVFCGCQSTKGAMCFGQVLFSWGECWHGETDGEQGSRSLLD